MPVSEAFIGALAIIGVFGTIFTGLYLFFTTRHKERMALIEQGKEASIFYSNKRLIASGALKIGLLAIGIGVGIITGYLLSSMGMMEEPAYFASMFIFGGLGLLINYRITDRKNQEWLDHLSSEGTTAQDQPV